MVDDWVIKTMYATKRRRKNPKSIKPLGGGARHEQNVKSNPSKRHRERLNFELEHLASLLPFEQNVIVKLDKLSILRLAVSYLRMKCYFQALSYDRPPTENRLVSHLYPCPLDLTRVEGEACLQAFNGFIFIMSCDGEVFSVSKTVEHYLGFHQADILHQSILELIHSEDRDEFRRQLSWRYKLPPELQSCTPNDLVTRPDLSHYLKRQFTVRFRCLLDNTSGFITLEISGRLQFIHGQSRGKHSNHMGAMRSASCTTGAPSSSTAPPKNLNGSHMNVLPPLGMFVVCSPLGPVPSLNGAQRDMTFKTKHQLDFTVTSIDSRTRAIFNYTDSDLQQFKVYDLVHPEDLGYVAQGHREVLQTGSIGLLVHRWLNKSGTWIWLQSRVKLVLKNGKHDHLVAIHRHLSYQEGAELLIRRSDEYKLPFPLLEPETLLSEDTVPEHHSTDFTEGFRPVPTRDMDYHYLGSVINGLPANGVMEKGGRGYPIDSILRTAEPTHLFRDGLLGNNTTPKKLVDPNGLVDPNAGHSSANFTAEGSRSGRPATSRGRAAGRIGSVRKKRNTAKEGRYLSCEVDRPDYPTMTNPFQCGPIPTVDRSPAYPYNPNQHYGLPYLNATTYNHLHTPWLTGDPATSSDLTRKLSPSSGGLRFDGGPSWPNRDQSNPHPLTPRLIPSGHVSDPSNPVHGKYLSPPTDKSADHHVGYRLDGSRYAMGSNYPAYPFNYDAYAVAAAAVVAAASGCQQPQPQLHHHQQQHHHPQQPEQHTKRPISDCYDLFPYLDQTLSRVYHQSLPDGSNSHGLDQAAGFGKSFTDLQWSTHARPDPNSMTDEETGSLQRLRFINRLAALSNDPFPAAQYAGPELGEPMKSGPDDPSADPSPRAASHCFPTKSLSTTEMLLCESTAGGVFPPRTTDLLLCGRNPGNHGPSSSERHTTDTSPRKPRFPMDDSLPTNGACSHYWSADETVLRYNTYTGRLSQTASNSSNSGSRADVKEPNGEVDRHHVTLDNKSTSSLCSTGSSSRTHSPDSRPTSAGNEGFRQGPGDDPRGQAGWSGRVEKPHDVLGAPRCRNTDGMRNHVIAPLGHGYRLEEMHPVSCAIPCLPLPNPVQKSIDTQVDNYRGGLFGSI